MKVAGVDLSLTGTGLAMRTVEPQRSWDLRTIETSTTTGSLNTWARLTGIVDQVEDFVAEANLVVIEQPNYSSTRGSKAADRAGLFWLVVDRIWTRTPYTIPIAFVTSSSRAKYATGKGNSAKDAVLAAAVRRYGDAPISNNNEADATVLAAMGAHWMGYPPAGVGLAAFSALEAVEWPPGYEHRQPSDTPLPVAVPSHREGPRHA